MPLRGQGAARRERRAGRRFARGGRGDDLRRRPRTAASGFAVPVSVVQRAVRGRRSPSRRAPVSAETGALLGACARHVRGSPSHDRQCVGSSRCSCSPPPFPSAPLRLLTHVPDRQHPDRCDHAFAVTYAVPATGCCAVGHRVQMPEISRRRALAYVLALLALVTLAGRVASGPKSGAECCAGESPGRARAGAQARRPRRRRGRKPGLYSLHDGSRVDDAISQAGGPRPKAALELVNLAAPVADGQQVVVPSKAGSRARPRPAACRGRLGGRVHLNSATLEQLDTLPGVGPVTAQKILDYRTEHGAFGSVDELDAVPGIGPARLGELRSWSTCDAGAGPAPRICSPARCAWVLPPRSPFAARPLVVGVVGHRARGGVRSPAARRAPRPRRRAPPRRLVVGQPAPRRARRSVLAGGVGRAGPRAAWRSPVRRAAVRSPFACRCASSASTKTLDEPARLDLPRGRAPPQGALVELVAQSSAPRGPERTASTRRRTCAGRASTWSSRRARSGSSATAAGSVELADRLRARARRVLAPGVTRRAAGGHRRGRARRGRGARSGAARPLPRVRPLSPARRVGPERRLRRGGRACCSPGSWAFRVDRRRSARSAAVAGYVMAVGWQPSVVRAGVAGGLASLAWLAGRARDRWYFLLVGAAVLLAWNPYSLLEPGFQLSFAAVAAIFVARPAARGAARGLPVPRGLATVLAVSLACGGVTAPILMLQFGLPRSTRCRATRSPRRSSRRSSGWPSSRPPSHPVLPGAAAALAWVNGWLAAYLAGCARFFGGLPHAQLTSWRTLAALAGLVAFAVLLSQLPPPRGRRAAVLAAIAGARPRRLAAPAGSTSPLPPQGLRIVMLDVGQGDGIAPADAGRRGARRRGPARGRASQPSYGGSASRGWRRWSLTHPQRDHVGGAADVLDRSLSASCSIRWSPPTAPRRARSSGRRGRATCRSSRRGSAARTVSGALRIRVLWPDGPGRPGRGPARARSSCSRQLRAASTRS